ncbi:hypothetical protein JF549_08860 [Labrenzia aggregata]|nr:hypothetical protein [Roseibium aggregatum]
MLGMYWSDVTCIRELDRAMSKLSGRTIRLIGSRSLNRAGSQGRTRTGRALVKQTGLKLRTVRAAMVPVKASASSLVYRIKARGGDIALKHFDARETRSGVSARPFGQRKIFKGTFIRGGKFPSRVALNMGGHVYARSGSGRLPIKKQKSGVILPRELVKGASAEAWQTTVAKVLPMRVIHEVKRATGKVFG